jgi:putative intracellular protease/amidase
VSHLVERILQTGWAVNLDLPDERFDPTKEAFDVAVVPGGADWNSLVTNADQLQEGLEHRAFEDELVVSADGVWFAVKADGQPTCFPIRALWRSTSCTTQLVFPAKPLKPV